MHILSYYQFNDKEIKELLSTLTILIDSREQENAHIKKYFDTKNIPYKVKKLDTGDYAAMMPKNVDYGITRDLFFPVCVERKNSVNELVASVKDRTRFENELIRSKKSHFTLLIEDQNGYEKIIKGNFQADFRPKALLASLKSFESRYDFTTVYIPKELSGNYLYYHLYYHARNMLK